MPEVIQTAFTAGELAPALYGRVDIDKYQAGAATMRNFFVDYRSGASTRPGTAFVGFDAGRVIPFRFSADQAFVIVLGNQYARFIYEGGYILEAAKPVVAATIAAQAVITVEAHGYNPGDVVFITEAAGLVRSNGANGLNGRYFIVAAYDPNRLILVDPISGNQVSSVGWSAYSGSGMIARVYTLALPYALADLRDIKFTQSADVMTLTHPSYPAADLGRVNDTNWTYTPITFGSSLTPPQSLVGTAEGLGRDGQLYAYLYCVTAVDDNTREESNASAPLGMGNLLLNTESSDGAIPFNVISFDPVSKATRYNIYKQTVYPETGSLAGLLQVWGYIGQTVTTKFTDNNIAPDFSESPPIHFNPFAGAGVVSFDISPPQSTLPIRIDGAWANPPALFSGVDWLAEYGFVAPTVSVTGPISATQPSVTFPNTTALGVDVQNITILSPGDGFVGPTAPATISEAAPGPGSGLVVAFPSDITKVKFITAAGGYSYPSEATIQSLLVAGGQNYHPSFVLSDITFAGAWDTQPLGLPQYGSAVGVMAGGGWTLTITPSGGGTPYVCSGSFVINNGSVVGLDFMQNWVATSMNNVSNTASFSGSIVITADPGSAAVPGTSYTPVNAPSVGAPSYATIGNSTNYPAVCCYFQGRKVFAASNQDPQTIWMTRPGLFQNMDYSTPAQDDDSIDITINAQDLSTITSITPVPAGLIALTADGAFLITGGGLYQPVQPSTINAQPQSFSGASSLQPLRINSALLYVQARGFAVRQLQYNFYLNNYAGQDISVLSSHLFEGRQIVEWCFAEQPYYLAWALRDDGVLLSLTYLSEQEIQGWAHHDTQGYFRSLCSIPEGDEDAVYAIVERFTPAGAPISIVERMASRYMGVNQAQALASNPELAWCVDAGVQVTPNRPAANLSFSLENAAAVGSVEVVNGGFGWPDGLTGTIVDDGGNGSGAMISISVAGGAIVAVAVTAGGAGYSAPRVVLPEIPGAGRAVLQAMVSNTCQVSADAAVFAADEVGGVIRASGAKLLISEFVNPQTLICTVLAPFREFLPNTSRLGRAASGTWTIAGQVQLIAGLDHLEGQQVMALADGAVVGPLTVAQGAITLPNQASIVTVGLGYTCQLQSLRLDVGQGGPSTQGKRKKISAVTIRVSDAAGLQVGSHFGALRPIKPVGRFDATQAPPFSIGGGVQAVSINGLVGQVPAVALDQRINLDGGWNPDGQVCIQQSNPLPASILALMPEVVFGDSTT